TALWHPAVLYGAASPPRLGSPYDYEQPSEGHVYALPESPPLILPDDWDQRVADMDALAFRAGAERPATLVNLQDALRATGSGAPALLDLEPEKVRPFFGIGFGYLMIETLCEAMQHENFLATGELWQDIQHAIDALADPDA